MPPADLIFYTTSFAPDHVDGNGEIKCVELALEKRPNGERVLVRRVSSNLLNPQTVAASQGSLTPQGMAVDTETLCAIAPDSRFAITPALSGRIRGIPPLKTTRFPPPSRVTLQLQRSGGFCRKTTSHSPSFAFSQSPARQPRRIPM